MGTTGKISIASCNGRALACAQGMLACLRRPHLRPPAADTSHHEESFCRPCRTPPAEQKEQLAAPAGAASSTALLDCCCLRCAATTAAAAELQAGADVVARAHQKVLSSPLALERRPVGDIEGQVEPTSEGPHGIWREERTRVCTAEDGRQSRRQHDTVLRQEVCAPRFRSSFLCLRLVKTISHIRKTIG